MARTYDPFRELDRFMGQVLNTERTSAQMPMDLYQSGEYYMLNIDVPGVDADTIDVSVEDRTLTIRAERKAPGNKDIKWLAKECPTGTYARQLTVGRGLALDSIDATYSDGVLSLKIPVAEEAKPRRIEVAHGKPSPIEITADA